MADEVTHVAFGDFWLEKLTQEQPWRGDRARAAQEEFEKGLAMVRQMAMSYVGSSMQKQPAPGADGNGAAP